MLKSSFAEICKLTIRAKTSEVLGGSGNHDFDVSTQSLAEEADELPQDIARLRDLYTSQK